MASGYEFLVETYRTERLKVLTVWSMFRDEDLDRRPHPRERRGRSLLEHMVHQCSSEDLWFKKMFGIEIAGRPLPEREERMAFIRCYARASAERLQALARRPRQWWEEEISFFGEARSRAWIMLRRIAHTAHHRGQQTALLRVLGREIYSTYGPTADTGGLPAQGARTIYPYRDEAALVREEARTPLPGPGASPPTERPGSPSGSGHPTVSTGQAPGSPEASEAGVSPAGDPPCE